jgi:DNA-binding LacI/PurR family transcriptional regulator
MLQLLDKQVAGVALLPPTTGITPNYHFRQLQSQGIPVVLLHRPVEKVSAPLIALPYDEVSTVVAKKLLDMGHRRVAGIFSHQSQAVSRYVHPLRHALHQAGASLPDELLYYGTHGVDPYSDDAARECESALEKMLSLPIGRRPTAIFDPWDAHMELVYLWLTRSGFRVPEDVSLVSFGGAQRTSTLAKRLAAIIVDEKCIAELATRRLNEMCRGERAITDTTVDTVPLGFRAGRTLAPPIEGMTTG